MDELAPALVAMTLFTSIAAIAIFRPLTKRLGDLLHQVHRDRQADRLDRNEIAQLKALLEQTNARLELMEERLDFTERLLGAGPRGYPRGVPDSLPHTTARTDPT